MDTSQRDAVIKWFEKYSMSFADSRGYLGLHLKLKYDHSYRVADNALKIATELAWSQKGRIAGYTAGLVHDTGRFPQFRDFGTFYDPYSVDHGERGYQVLVDRFPVDILDNVTLLILKESTRYHNKRSLAAVAEYILPFLKLVRDADKLDIYEVVRANVEKGRMAELMPGIDIDGGVSEALVNEINNQGSASYANVRTLSDFLFLQISWLYDMNYQPSIDLFRERDTCRWFFAYLRKYDVVQSFLDNLESKLLLKV